MPRLAVAREAREERRRARGSVRRERSSSLMVGGDARDSGTQGGKRSLLSMGMGFLDLWATEEEGWEWQCFWSGIVMVGKEEDPFEGFCFSNFTRLDSWL